LSVRVTLQSGARSEGETPQGSCAADVSNSQYIYDFPLKGKIRSARGPSRESKAGGEKQNGT